MSHAKEHVEGVVCVDAADRTDWRSTTIQSVLAIFKEILPTGARLRFEVERKPEDPRHTSLRLYVTPEAFGCLIGRGGKTMDATRVILTAAWAMHRETIRVETFRWLDSGSATT